MARTLYIKEAEYAEGLSLRITFNDGVQREVDFSRFFTLNSHPQYNKYREPKKFKKFAIEEGNVVWGKNWDLMFPITTLYSGAI